VTRAGAIRRIGQWGMTLGNRAKRTEHAGAKRGCGAYCGPRHRAKRDSAITRRRAGRKEIEEPRRDYATLEERSRA
jgi:hypothetical protein